MNTLLAIHDPGEAAGLFRKGVALAKSMAEDTADATAQRDYAVAQLQLASAIQAVRPGEPLQQYAAGISLLRLARAAAPDQRELDRVLAQYLPGYAVALAGAGRTAALDEAREAVNIAFEFVRRSPASIQAQRLLLTASLASADAHLTLNRPAAVPSLLDRVRATAEAGELRKISQSLLHDRARLYALMCRAAARTGAKA